MRWLAHELWLSAIAVAAITGWYAVRAQSGIPPAGKTLGHSLGVVGFLMMLSTETLYTLRKRAKRFAFGPTSIWLKAHVFTGIVGPCLVLLHTGWKFHGVAGAATLFTVVIVMSGFVGRYIFTAVPRSREGVEAALHDLNVRILDACERLHHLGAAQVAKSAIVLANQGRRGGWRSVLGRHFLRGRLPDALAPIASALKKEEDAWTKRLSEMLIERHRLQMQIDSLASARRLLALWHIVHIPLGGVLFVLAFIHIGAALYYSTLLKW